MLKNYSEFAVEILNKDLKLVFKKAFHESKQKDWLGKRPH